MKENRYKWNFFKAGGSVQVNILSGDDIKNLDTLDPKLWSALSCPVGGLSLDKKTLEIVDADSDGGIRREELIQACKWTCARLKNADELVKSSPTLPLGSIADTDDGAILLKSAKEVLSNLGKSEAEEISVDDFADQNRIFAASAFNADGIITELSCREDGQLKELFFAILSVSTPQKDRSGLDGIDAAAIDTFFKDAKALTEWRNRGESPEILTLADKTAEQFAALQDIEKKIDEWFTASAMLAFAADAKAQISAQENEKLAAAYTSKDTDALKALPLFALNTSAQIDFSKPPNPEWATQVENFKNKVLAENAESEKLDKARWNEIRSKFAAYREWLEAKPQTKLEDFSTQQLLSYTTDENRAKLQKLIDAENAVSDEIQNIANVEKLVRLNANLYTLLKNFVSLQDFYSNSAKGIFQFGTLFIDRRMCTLCVKVEDVAKHSAMASLGYGYLLYCNCTRKGETPITIAAMVTAGDSDNLIVGRNGIFYDNFGREWNANITKIIDNPIGIAQAFFSPYKRIIKWASQQISKQAADTDKTVISNITDGKMVKKTDADKKKIDIGTVAALGVAIGGITTAFGMVLEAVFGLGYWLPLGVVGILLAISLPSVFIAWLKLRMRNLAPLLDGNGWAVNCNANVNMLFGAHLTRVAAVPAGAHFSGIDRFPSKCKLSKKSLVWILAIAAVIGAFFLRNCAQKQCETAVETAQTDQNSAENKSAANTAEQKAENTTKTIESAAKQ